MKKLTNKFFTAVIILCSLNACGQSDNDLLKEAGQKLKSETVSAVLTDKKFLGIHPLTEFREMIRDHATASVLSTSTTDEPGKKIKVLGSITDQTGNGIADALVYLYQTDSRGWYASDAPHVLQNEGDMRHARLFGYVKTDANGKFELHTVKPSGYPNSDLPAHIHVHIWKSGFQNFVSEFLFDDDDRLKDQIRENAIKSQFLVSKPEKATPGFDQQFSYHVVLRKN